MRSPISHARFRLAASAAIAAGSAAVLAVAMSGGVSSAATAGPHHTPAVRHAPLGAVGVRAAAKTAQYDVQPQYQQFASSTTPFCPAASGNAPCDGVSGAYGTIDRVPSGFSNGGAGNYAPSTRALVGDWMALVSGTGVGNQGAGCPGTTATSNPGENCSGPYALFGTGKAAGVENVFPKAGFTVTDDLFLSPSTAGPAGSLVDDDVEMNTSAGAYGIDNIITACAEDTTSAALGYVISFGHNSPGGCTGTPVVTKDGWYRFVFVFSDKAGDAYVTESVFRERTGALVATSGPQPVGAGSPEKISAWGGPGYFWLPTEDYSGLPLANFAIQLGQFSHGHRP